MISLPAELEERLLSKQISPHGLQVSAGNCCRDTQAPKLTPNRYSIESCLRDTVHSSLFRAPFDSCPCLSPSSNEAYSTFGVNTIMSLGDSTLFEVVDQL